MERRSLVIVLTIGAAALAVAAMLIATRDDSSDATAATSDLAADTTTSLADQSTTTSSTTAESTTTTSLPADPALPADACAPYTSITTVNSVVSDSLVETSGIAASRTRPGVLWAHNDSRDGARVYAIGPDGSDLGGFDIAGAFAFDWEDMAAGPGSDPATSNLYLGDIGDNFSIRGGRITVYRVPEPDPDGLEGPITGATALEFEYPDGSHNAEALFVVDQSIYIVTKDRDEARVYRGSSESDGSEVETMELVTTLALGAEVTGADISWDDSTIALRGYDTVWLWRKTATGSVAETLGEEPCAAPSPDEVQGEAIAFTSDGGYQTISEGERPDLFLIPFDA